MEFSPCWAKTRSLREEGALEGGKLCHEQKSDCREILSLVAAQLSSYFVFAPVGRKLHHIYYLLFFSYYLSCTYSKGPPCCGRAFRAGVRNRKRRMAIVKGCTFTPGCVFTVRGGGAASKENGVVWAGCCLRGSSPSRRGAFYMRPSTGSPLRADMESAPTEPRGECPYITRCRTAYGCSRAAASNPHRPGSRPHRRRRAGRPSRG